MTRVEELTAVRVRFGYRLLKGPERKIVATGFSLHAATDGQGVPRRIPPEVRESLERDLSGPETGR